jgi:hypothetical protein
MNSETPNERVAANARPGKRPSPEHLSALLKALRHTNSEIHAELRKCLAVEGNLLFSPPPQTYIRRTQQLEKAHELFRQAEAKIELLVAHFGGTL